MRKEMILNIPPWFAAATWLWPEITLHNQKDISQLVVVNPENWQVTLEWLDVTNMITFWDNKKGGREKLDAVFYNPNIDPIQTEKKSTQEVSVALKALRKNKLHSFIDSYRKKLEDNPELFFTLLKDKIEDL